MRPNATIKNVQRVFGGGDSTLGLIGGGDAIKSGEYGGEPENMIITHTYNKKNSHDLSNNTS
jgi:hypothetical protein